MSTAFPTFLFFRLDESTLLALESDEFPSDFRPVLDRLEPEELEFLLNRPTDADLDFLLLSSELTDLADRRSSSDTSSRVGLAGELLLDEFTDGERGPLLFNLNEKGKLKLSFGEDLLDN